MYVLLIFIVGIVVLKQWLKNFTLSHVFKIKVLLPVLSALQANSINSIYVLCSYSSVHGKSSFRPQLCQNYGCSKLSK